MATFNSAEYANQINAAQKVSVDTIAKLFLAKFNYTQVGAGTIGDDVNLIELPAGKITIYPDLSRLITTDHGGTATLSVGLRAYYNSAGVLQAEDDAALASAVDVSGAAVDAALTLPADGRKVLDTRNGVVVHATNAASAIPNAGTINGWIAFTRG